MKITINQNIKDITPDFEVAVLTCDVKVYDNPDVSILIDNIEKSIYDNFDITDIVNLPIIIDGRNAYKKYGKDPSRYRLAVESLYRRLSKGNSLYRINNVVDLGNILSIKTRKSVAVLDYDKIVGDVHIRLGRETDDYHGIGRGKINITNIPLYEDDLSPFGSVTSDTNRTMIQDDTQKILLFIISFSGKTNLLEEIQYAKDIYEKYANGSNFNSYII